MKKIFSPSTKLFYRIISLTVIIICCIASLSSAQFSAIYHNENIIGNPRPVGEDAQGNVYLTGWFRDTITLGTFVLTSPNGFTGYIAKMEAGTNTWLWAKQIVPANPGSTGSIMKLDVDNAGNTYISDSYSGVITFDNLTLTSTQNNNGYTDDIFVAKLNTNGVFTWVKSLGSNLGNDGSHGITADALGNVYVTGQMYKSKSKLSCGSKPIYNIYIAKLNSTGSIVWEKQYTNTNKNLDCNPGPRRGKAIATDNTGNVVFTGDFDGTFNFGNGQTISSTSTHVFTAKLNSAGTCQWVKASTGSSWVNGEAIYTDNAGNVYTGGQYDGTTNFGSVSLANSGGASNSFLVKYSSSGVVSWAVNPYPNTVFADQVKCIIPTTDGNIRITDSWFGPKVISPINGTILSSDPLVGNNEVNLYADPSTTGVFRIESMTSAGAGYMFSAIAYCGEVSIGGTILNVPSCTDCTTGWTSCGVGGHGVDHFIVTAGTGLPAIPSGVNTNTFLNHDSPGMNSLEIYPNPASDEVRIRLPKFVTGSTIRIYNQIGQLVWSKVINEEEQIIRIPLDIHWQNGIYHICSFVKGEVLTKKLIISR